MVELTIGWLDEVKATNGVARWLELVETLRGVTEGKVKSLQLFRSYSTQTKTVIFADLPRNPSRKSYSVACPLS